jgi:S-adenosylmethionine/arginine decarboxylase-like enzyme
MPDLSSLFAHRVAELGGIDAACLRDGPALSALVVAAAGAVGIAAVSPPLVRQSPGGYAVGLICAEGHIALHTVPDRGLCLVDILSRIPSTPERGVDVIARRLAARSVA